MSVNRVNVPPTRILSTYLLNTIFGQCIIGKIPGSTKLANSDAINTLSVVHVATGNIEGRDELHHPKLLSCDETLDSFNVDEVVSEFSSFSDIGINLDDREKLNVDAQTHFKDTVKYHEDSKQFECGIPWVNSNPPEDLPHNQFIIFRMFLSTILLIATVTSLLLHGKEELSAEHLFKAETLWFGELQSIYFSEELAFLSNIQNHATKDSFTKRIVRQNKLVAPSLCIDLNLFLDQDGLIRLFVSLANSEHINYNTKFPIFLPREDQVTRLLVMDFHVIAGHFGVQQTLNSVRTRFWIPKLGKVVPQIIKSCINCKIYISQCYHVPLSPPLPKFRVSDVDPFTFCGIDMSGNLFVKYGTETVKRFVILFACCFLEPFMWK